MRQDAHDYQKPMYDWVEPKTINFLFALMTGVCGGMRQGSWQGVEIFTDFPDTFMNATNYMMFGEDTEV